MTNSDRVFLVGPMGVGKTTLGRLLAAEFCLPFKDSDKEIEARCGADIPWIFDVEGEQGFRRRETRILDELTGLKKVLLATGGGVVLKEENRRMLAARGFVVYLTSDVNQLFERTRKDKNRPLLQVENPRQVIEKLLKERDPLYREVADLVVDVGKMTTQQAQDKIISAIRSK